MATPSIDELDSEINSLQAPPLESDLSPIPFWKLKAILTTRISSDVFSIFHTKIAPGNDES